MALIFNRENYNDEIDETNCIKTGYDLEDLKKLSGLINNQKELIYLNGFYPAIRIGLLSIEDLFVYFTVDFERRFIINFPPVGHTSVKEVVKRFSLQVKLASNLGFEKIYCVAFGDRININKFSEYLVLGKLGYNMIPISIKETSNIGYKNGEANRPIYEILSTKEDQEIWYKEGFTWIGCFDLTKTEPREILKKYSRKLR